MIKFGYIEDDDSQTREEYEKCCYYKPDHYSFSNSLKRFIAA